MTGAQQGTRGRDELEVGACGVGVAEGYVDGGAAAHDEGRHAHGAGGCLHLPDGACGFLYLVEDGRLGAVLIAVEGQINVAAYGYDERGVEVDRAFKTAVERDVGDHGAAFGEDLKTCQGKLLELGDDNGACGDDGFLAAATHGDVVEADVSLCCELEFGHDILERGVVVEQGLADLEEALGAALALVEVDVA